MDSLLTEQQERNVENILTTYSQESLARAIEENHDDQLLNLGRNIGAKIYDGPELKGFITDHPSPTFNVVSRTRLRPEVADAKIREILGVAKAHRVPLGWWIWPTTEPRDLGKRLVSAGFSYKGDGRGMAADLNKIKLDNPAPKGLTFETVCDEEMLRNFLIPFAAVHKVQDFVLQALFKSFSRMGFGLDQPYRHYIGWMEDKPVASRSRLLSAGVVGGYNVVTLPEYRRAGVGGAMLSHVLRETRAMGYRFAVGVMSPMMQSVSQRTGYKEMFKVGYYEWMPKKKKKHVLERLSNYIFRALR